MKNGRNLGIRLDQETTERLEAFERDTKVDAVTLARAALIAALDTYTLTGLLTLPLQVVSSGGKSGGSGREKLAS